MSDKPSLLYVEDDPILARLIETALGDDYRVTRVASGEACLDTLAETRPELVVMDVGLPGMDGYETCRRMREMEAGEEVWVVFLSAHDGMVDRLAGYEAGGHDYLVKPVEVAELKRKLAILLADKATLRGLRESASDAFKTAMLAMSSAAELGVVMQALRQGFQAGSYQAVASIVLEATAQFGLEASVQVRGRHGRVSLNALGPCSPLEESVLANLAEHDRIVDLGSRTAVNFPLLSIIAKNMPREDAERYGRLKDSLAFLVEGLDARVRALDAELGLAREHGLVLRLIERLGQVLAGYDASCRSCRREYEGIVGDLGHTVVGVVERFNLTEKQRELLEDYVAAALEDVGALSEQRLLLDAQVRQVMAELAEAVGVVGGTPAGPSEAA